MNARIGRQYPLMAARESKYRSEEIIAQIVSEFVNRSRQNIQTWRQGLESADDPLFPRWHTLQDLYEYLSTDGHLQSQIFLRKAAVLGKRFFVRDSLTGKEKPEKTKSLQKKWYISTCNKLLDAEFRAYTVLQFAEPKALVNPHPILMPFSQIPRRNFIPQQNVVLLQAGGMEGVSIIDPAFRNTILCMKSEDQFGLLNYIVKDLIWKKNARQAWAEFGDKFGIPLVKVITNKSNKNDLDKIEAMAKQMGKAARAILPEGTTMDIISDATKGDPYQIYLQQVNLGNAEISKVILCGTMVTDNGSSRSQSEVHERNLDDKVNRMDLTNLEFVLNDQLIPLLVDSGLGFSATDEIAIDVNTDIEVEKHWNIVSGMISKGYDIDKQWLMKKFNVPIVGRKEPPRVYQPTSFFD